MSQSTYHSDHRWVTVWGAMPQRAEDENMPPPPFTQENVTFLNTTIRQTLRVTTGGNQFRIRISNAFGSTKLSVTAATIALPRSTPDGYSAGANAIMTDTVRFVTFNRQSAADVPAGALVVSDAISLSVQAGQVISISIYLSQGQTGSDITSHPGSRTRSWLCNGNHVAAEKLSGNSLQSIFHWYFISGVEAWQPKTQSRGALVVLGDSLTDGRCSTDNGNNRWLDLLFDRMLLHNYAQHIAVVNQAAGGNRVLTDGKGPNLLSRLDRDLFGQVGISYVMVFHGVNDIGTAEKDAESQDAVGDQLIRAYEQIITRAHSASLPVFGSTIGPFGGSDSMQNSYASPFREETRQRVNDWIRAGGGFDAVIDLDSVLRDPDNPSHLKPDYDSGDGLHPNVHAFQAMAEAFPLTLFKEFAQGIHMS